jgi:hypothetical protein
MGGGGREFSNESLVTVAMDTTYKQNKAILLNKWHDFGQLGSI